MQKPKTLKYIGSICFFAASLILGVFAAIHDDRFVYKLVPGMIKNVSKWRASYSVCGLNSTILFALLIVVSFLLVIIGFLTEKKRHIMIGAITGIAAQCLSCSGLPLSIAASLDMGKWYYHRPWLHGGASLLFELLFILYLVALLLCSLDPAHGRIYGIIGAVLMLVRLIPSGYVYSGYVYGSLGIFLISPWTIVVSVLFAVGSWLLGTSVAPKKAKKTDRQDTSVESITKIEKIVKLKELLDIGAITPEEFEAKKKQIIEE